MSDNNLPDTQVEALTPPPVIPKQPFISKKILIAITAILLFSLTGTLIFIFATRNKKSQPLPPVTRREISPTVSEISPTPYTPEKQLFLVESIKQISSAHNILGINILKLQLTEEKITNILLSPSSIHLAFSMAYNGAAAETKTAMAKTLMVSEMDIATLNKQSNDLLQYLRNPEPGVQISVANSIWSRKDFQINPAFLSTNQENFQAKIASLDFALPESADVINSWVKENTNNKITSIISPPISPDMVMFLLNAVYFKGTWTFEFDKKLTEKKDFFQADRTANKVEMMRQKREDFDYLDTDNFQAVKLPYGENKRLEMIVFLPKNNLSSFMSLLTIDNWHDWLAKFQIKEGTVILPKFKIDYELILNNPLKKLGMEIAFTQKADFSNIAPNLFISEAKHKTYIDVNEEGTEAAAVTSIGIGITLAMPTFYMEVNKPFFYSIFDKLTGEMLFIGVVNKLI